MPLVSSHFISSFVLPSIYPMFLAVEQKTQNYAYAMWHGGGGSRTVAFVRSAEDKSNTHTLIYTHTHTHTQEKPGHMWVSFWSVNCRMQIFAHAQNVTKHDFERCKLGAVVVVAATAAVAAAAGRGWSVKISFKLRHPSREPQPKPQVQPPWAADPAAAADVRCNLQLTRVKVMRRAAQKVSGSEGIAWKWVKIGDGGGGAGGQGGDFPRTCCGFSSVRFWLPGTAACVIVTFD